MSHVLYSLDIPSEKLHFNLISQPHGLVDYLFKVKPNIFRFYMMIFYSELWVHTEMHTYRIYPATQNMAKYQ